MSISNRTVSQSIHFILSKSKCCTQSDFKVSLAVSRSDGSYLNNDASSFCRPAKSSALNCSEPFSSWSFWPSLICFIRSASGFISGSFAMLCGFHEPSSKRYGLRDSQLLHHRSGSIPKVLFISKRTSSLLMMKGSNRVRLPKMSKMVHAAAQMSAGNPILSPKNASGDRSRFGVCDFARSSFEKDASSKSMILTCLVRPFSYWLSKCGQENCADSTV